MREPCERVAFGYLEPGLQTSFCESTGGGWSTLLVAHPTQLVEVPDSVTDEQAVLVEPTACAVHAATAVGTGPSDVAVIGSGTLGLLTIAAIAAEAGHADHRRRHHPHQKRLAKELGAEVVCSPTSSPARLRSRTGLVGRRRPAHGRGRPGRRLRRLGSVAPAGPRRRRPGGTAHAVGMPGVTTSTSPGCGTGDQPLRRCYAYTPDDFVTATRLVAELDLGRLVTATYPLSRYEDAIAHAANAGRREP